MAKQYLQRVQTVFDYTSGSFLANGASSGSTLCDGYSQLRGLFYSGDATETGSGLHIEWSSDGGTTWDYTSASDAIGASVATACIVDVIGNAVRVTFRNGATAGSTFRSRFYLLPIS